MTEESKTTEYVKMTENVKTATAVDKYRIGLVKEEDTEEIYKNIEDPWGLGSNQSKYEGRVNDPNTYGKYLAKAKRLLGIGCGVGSLEVSIDKVAGSLYPNLEEICGIDISKTAIEKATVNLETMQKELGYDGGRTKFMVVNATAEPLPRGYDLMIALESLYYTTNSKAMCKNIDESLVPGGYFIVGDSMRIPYYRWIFKKTFGYEIVDRFNLDLPGGVFYRNGVLQDPKNRPQYHVVYRKPV